jgi:hypothetical protein
MDYDFKNWNEAQARALMTLANIPVNKVHPCQNKYHGASRPNAAPWFLIETPWGLFEIGPRKRVYSISWESTSLRHIVTEDNVTKDQISVDAWTLAKAVEYLTALAGWALKQTETTQHGKES